MDILWTNTLSVIQENIKKHVFPWPGMCYITLQIYLIITNKQGSNFNVLMIH